MPLEVSVGSNLAPVGIYDEVLLARLDLSTRFSYIRKSVLLELGIFNDSSMILLPIKFEESFGHFIFEVRGQLLHDIMLGNYIINTLQIVPIDFK